jgi:hypothetical protein
MEPSYYLLTFNEDEGSFTGGTDGLMRAVELTRRGEFVEENWSLATNFKKIKEADIVFIRRSKRDGRRGGIIARGTVIGSVYKDDNEWRDKAGVRTPRPENKPPYRIRFRLDSVLSPEDTPPEDFFWAEASGSTIPPDAARKLESAWRDIFGPRGGAEDSEEVDAEEERTRTRRLIDERRGQPGFRQALIKAYKGQCAFTTCNEVEALEAAHIKPCAQNGEYRVQNGFLLRADVHTLFDLDLIKVNPVTRKLELAPEIADGYYKWLKGNPLNEEHVAKADRAGTIELKSRFAMAV